MEHCLNSSQTSSWQIKTMLKVAEYMSVASPNTEKIGTKKLRIWALFTQSKIFVKEFVFITVVGLHIVNLLKNVTHSS